MSDEYRIALARALGRHEKDAGIAGEPVIAALAHASRVKAMEAEIERLRKRLELPREADAKEVERLRAALDAIMRAGEFPDEHTIGSLAHMAERALEQGAPK